MIEDEIIMSVEAIYKSKEFRQITYKQKGIKYVTEYREKIQNIIYELNMRKQWSSKPIFYKIQIHFSFMP